jgi:hypothetical protein
VPHVARPVAWERGTQSRAHAKGEENGGMKQTLTDMHTMVSSVLQRPLFFPLQSCLERARHSACSGASAAISALGRRKTRTFGL